jgi:hypothetical protein
MKGREDQRKRAKPASANAEHTFALLDLPRSLNTGRICD